MGKLTDKNILITGGNSGIGLAAAQEFDREGAHVAICGPCRTACQPPTVHQGSHLHRATGEDFRALFPVHPRPSRNC